jgi:hypothetical protein
MAEDANNKFQEQEQLQQPVNQQMQQEINNANNLDCNMMMSSKRMQES